MVTTDYRPGWRQGLTLAAQSIFPTMGSLMLVPVLPLLFAQFGTMPGARYLIPTLLTVPSLCIALLSPAMGVIGDRFGRRGLLIAALAVYGASGMLPFFLSSFRAIFAARIALGICEAAIITLSTTMIGDTFSGKERARWLAAISTIASLSAIGFFAISGALGSMFGWHGPFLLYGLSFLFLPAMLLWVREVGASPHGTPAAAEALAPFPWRHMLITAAVTLFGGVLFYTLVIQQGLALASLGVRNPARVGLLTAAASLATPLGTLMFMRIVRLGPARLLALEFSIIGAGCLAIGFVHRDIELACASAIGQFGAGMLLPTLITWTLSNLPPSARGRGTGIFQSMLTFSQFVSGLLIPFLSLHVTGSVLGSFGLLGGIALAAAICSLAIARRQPVAAA